MSDTPRTDALSKAIQRMDDPTDIYSIFVVSREHERELAALRADAERYRWSIECEQNAADLLSTIRGAGNRSDAWIARQIDAYRTGHDSIIDAAIDAAMGDKNA